MRALIFIMGLTLAGNGCSSLRPPAADRAAWEGQQKQIAARQELESEHDPVSNALYGAYELGQLGYFLATILK